MIEVGICAHTPACAPKQLSKYVLAYIRDLEHSAPLFHGYLVFLHQPRLAPLLDLGTR